MAAARGLDHQGQRGLDALPHHRKSLVQADDRRGVVQRGRPPRPQASPVGTTRARVSRSPRSPTCPQARTAGFSKARLRWQRPAGWLIKGNEDSMLYHPPDSPAYNETIAEVWFFDEGDRQGGRFRQVGQELQIAPGHSRCPPRATPHPCRRRWALSMSAVCPRYCGAGSRSISQVPPSGLSSMPLCRRGSRPAAPPAPARGPTRNVKPSTRGRTARTRPPARPRAPRCRCRRPRSRHRRGADRRELHRVAPPCFTALAIALSTVSRSPAGSPMMMRRRGTRDTSRSGYTRIASWAARSSNSVMSTGT